MTLDLVRELEKEMLDFMHDIHMHPELSQNEKRTSEKIQKELEKIGIPFRVVGNSSIIASLKGKGPGKTVAIRADLDALPIKEKSGVEYSSVNDGVMHACGHDAHMSMLLTAAKVLKQKEDEINGEVRFFFQEAEELFAGAPKIIEAGGMDGVDAIFGMHGMNGLKTGQANLQSGYRLSGADTIYITFKGESGHGSSPQFAKDTIPAACQFVLDLQQIVTKNNDPQEPIVISVGKFQAGTKANIITNEAKLDISMRSFDPKARERIHSSIIRHAENIAKMWEIEVEVEIEPSTPSTLNDEHLTELGNRVLNRVLGEENNVESKRNMASEDFAKYLTKAPGAYVFMGYYNEEKGSIYAPHNEKFKVDEDYLKYGAAVFAELALEFLNENKAYK